MMHIIVFIVIMFFCWFDTNQLTLLYTYLPCLRIETLKKKYYYQTVANIRCCLYNKKKESDLVNLVENTIFESFLKHKLIWFLSNSKNALKNNDNVTKWFEINFIIWRHSNARHTQKKKWREEKKRRRLKTSSTRWISNFTIYCTLPISLSQHHHIASHLIAHKAHTFASVYILEEMWIKLACWLVHSLASLHNIHLFISIFEILCKLHRRTKKCVFYRRTDKNNKLAIHLFIFLFIYHISEIDSEKEI